MISKKEKPRVRLVFGPAENVTDERRRTDREGKIVPAVQDFVYEPVGFRR